MACAFNKYKINLSDLEEYINWVDTPEFALLKHDNKTSLTLTRSDKKKSTKKYRDYLGYCDDPENKEFKDRESEEEYEYVYDYFPLMTRRTTSGSTPTVSTTESEHADKQMDVSLTVSAAVNTAGLQQQTSQLMDTSTTTLDTVKPSTSEPPAVPAEEKTIVVKNGTT